MHRGAPVDLVFQSIAGTEAANRSFGIDLALLTEAHQAALTESGVVECLAHREDAELGTSVHPTGLDSIKGIEWIEVQWRSDTRRKIGGPLVGDFLDAGLASKQRLP